MDGKVSDSVKAAMAAETRKKWESHVKDLAVQGNILALAAAEKQDIIWKSYMFDLKQGTLNFSLIPPLTLSQLRLTSRDGRRAAQTCVNCANGARPQNTF